MEGAPDLSGKGFKVSTTVGLFLRLIIPVAES